MPRPGYVIHRCRQCGHAWPAYRSRDIDADADDEVDAPLANRPLHACGEDTWGIVEIAAVVGDGSPHAGRLRGMIDAEDRAAAEEEGPGSPYAACAEAYRRQVTPSPAPPSPAAYPPG